MRMAPKINGAPPVVAPKRMCPAMPPALWQIGTPPMADAPMFMKPVEMAACFSFTGR